MWWEKVWGGRLLSSAELPCPSEQGGRKVDPNCLLWPSTPLTCPLPVWSVFMQGGGEVDLKLGLSVAEFTRAYSPFVIDCTYD